ncbi:MAG TPA: hypothetical protein VGZ69_06865, partial [Candidatus Rhabdochlamydia sp.]|nr:hypothetical protein [Candidatus Rhabdochlamydia sp.]
IEEFGIISEKDRAKIAMIAARQNGKGTSEYIEEFGIISEKDRAKIAMIAARQNGKGTSEFMKNYKITDQKLLFEIIKIFAEQDGKGTSECMKNYKITDQKLLFEIAMIAARQNGKGTSEYIEEFGIISEKDRAKIAMTAAEQGGLATSEFIKNYKITDEEVLIEIVSLAIKTSILGNLITDFSDGYFWDYLPNYGLSEKEFKKIQLIFASCYGIDHVQNSSMIQFIYDHIQSSQFPSLAIFNRKITEIKEQISREQDCYQLDKLKKKRQRALLYFSLVSEKCNDSNISLTEDQQNYFIKALEHHNQKESRLLMQVLAQNFEKPGYFSSYQQLVNKKEHLVLPMILINQWLMESPSSSDVCQKNIKQITDFLKGGKQRSSLRDAKGFLPHLLQALIALSHPSIISSEQKIHLLNQCLQSALPIDKEKEWEKRCKGALDTVYVLAIMNLLKPTLNELEENYTFRGITSLFSAKLQDILFSDTPIDHFYEKYVKMEEALRVSLALVKYASNLKSSKKASVSEELRRLITHVLEDSVKQERYQIENNLHLQKIKEGCPEIFQAWQTSQEMIEHKLGETKQKSIDFPAFLKEKILNDQHFPQAPLALREYLEEQPYSLKGIKETDQQVVLLCKELCDPSIDFTKKITVLKSLSSLLGQNEFKNDINSLHKTLTTTHQQKSVLMVDSDDWQDLFLSGTEVLGSCQRIDGDPYFNVCLMAYVLDGKNRILCIKDPATGRILARCIFRLLFKDNQPVLFQERIYPSPCEYEELLNQLAETRASELGLELFTCNIRDNLESGLYHLESLGSSSPYEYVDASKGKTEGVFRIDTAKKVIRLTGTKRSTFEQMRPFQA